MKLRKAERKSGNCGESAIRYLRKLQLDSPNTTISQVKPQSCERISGKTAKKSVNLSND